MLRYFDQTVYLNGELSMHDVANFVTLKKEYRHMFYGLIGWLVWLVGLVGLVGWFGWFVETSNKQTNKQQTNQQTNKQTNKQTKIGISRLHCQRC